EFCISISYKCADIAICIYFADSVIARVGNVDIAGPIRSNSHGTSKGRARGRAAVAAEPKRSVACKCADNACSRVYFSYCEDVCLRKVDIARSIYGNTLREKQIGVSSRTAVAESRRRCISTARYYVEITRAGVHFVD